MISKIEVMILSEEKRNGIVRFYLSTEFAQTQPPLSVEAGGVDESISYYFVDGVCDSSLEFVVGELYYAAEDEILTIRTLSEDELNSLHTFYLTLIQD